jgi:hypothetical protein
LQAEVDEMHRRHFDDPRLRKRGALLTRYIGNPALFTRSNGLKYKFHLRVYFLVVLGHDPRDNRAAVYRDGEIACAKQPWSTSFAVCANF